MLERRKARKAALEILYQREITESSVDLILHQHLYAQENDPLSDFCLRIIRGVALHQVEIDKLIKKSTAHWALERMPLLDRNIIRISIYEMLFEDDIPYSVSINEAIELAKIYGTSESSKFVNGVLGKIASNMSEKNLKDKRKECRIVKGANESG